MPQNTNMNFGAFAGDAQGKITLPAAYTGDSLTLGAQNAVIFSHASARFVPGATSLLFRNNANDATNMTILDAGGITGRTSITATTSLVATTTLTVGTGATITAGGLTITAGGLLVTAGRIREVLSVTDLDAQDGTLLVAAIVGGIVVHTSATGGGTVTLDTAANIVAGATGVGALTADGQTIKCYYINDGDQTVTLAGNTGITLGDAGNTILINEAATLLFRRTSATAVTVYTVGA